MYSINISRDYNGEFCSDFFFIFWNDYKGFYFCSDFEKSQRPGDIVMKR